ncbi:hypothetical protein TNCV_4680181 [Trichonephila clavipes]|nr:hypothetical protein TNCV_4680181 [Trichonephila clavipes]
MEGGDSVDFWDVSKPVFAGHIGPLRSETSLKEIIFHSMTFQEAEPKQTCLKKRYLLDASQVDGSPIFAISIERNHRLDQG